MLEVVESDFAKGIAGMTSEEESIARAPQGNRQGNIITPIGPYLIPFLINMPFYIPNV